MISARRIVLREEMSQFARLIVTLDSQFSGALGRALFLQFYDTIRRVGFRSSSNVVTDILKFNVLDELEL